LTEDERCSYLQKSLPESLESFERFTKETGVMQDG
jgi:hypothetical protein